jgi:hypothetical protein
MNIPTPFEINEIYREILAHPSYVTTLSDYLLDKILERAKEEKLSATKIIVDIMQANPNYPYPEDLPEDSIFKYWTEQVSDYKNAEIVEEIIKKYRSRKENTSQSEQIHEITMPKIEYPKIKIQEGKLIDLVELIYALDKSGIFLSPETGKKLNQQELIAIFENLTSEKIATQFGKLKNSRWEDGTYSEISTLSEKTFTIKLFRIVQEQITDYVKNKNK